MPISVQPSDDTVEVKLTGPSRIFGLKGRLDIPKGHVTSVEVLARKAVPPTPGTWLRAPGTHIPGLIRYGSYGREPHREFWAVYRQREVLVIGVKLWAYSRLVLATRDPQADAARLAENS